MTVLVFGARGHVGGAVLAGLIAAGVPVRASSRDPRPGDFPREVEVVRADLADRASLPAALDGVDGVLLYAQPGTAGAFAAAARAAGSPRVVLLSSVSVVLPDAATNPIAQLHVEAERAIDAAGLPRTFVRPAYFATNALRWTSIRTERRLRTAFPDGSTTMVHERDIADVAVRALRGGDLDGQAPAVLGPGPSTVREQVGAIASALGEAVEVEVVPEDAYRDELREQMPEAIVDRLLRARGVVPLPPPEVATDSIEALLGRPPLPFTMWARDHADDFR